MNKFNVTSTSIAIETSISSSKETFIPIPLAAANTSYLSPPRNFINTTTNKKRNPLSGESQTSSSKNTSNQVLKEDRYMLVGFPEARST
jgi:hypothetical protein